MATARTLDQIIAELNPTYQPQVQSIQNQMGLIPGQIAQGEAQLGAKKDQAYENILSGARSRGTGVAFGGIPLGEQAKYAATEYMPALANLRTAGTQQASSLQDALNAIQEKKMTLGQNIYQTEQDRAFQAEQNALNRKSSAANAAAGAITPTMISQLMGANTAPKATARAEQKTPGSFAFYSANNKPITAARYAKETGQNIGDILYGMGQAGDVSAQNIYNQLADRPDDPMINNILKLQFPHIMGGL
jgi:hypothetical protein